MTGIIISISICLLLAAILALYASSIPPEFNGTLQQKILAPSSRVWDYITDIEGIPLRNKSIKKVEVLKRDGLGITWKEYTDMGGYIIFEKKEEEGKVLEKRMIESSFGMKGTWMYEIKGDDDTFTIVTITEHSLVAKPLVKLMLAISGRSANLKREMKIIERFAMPKN